MGALSHMKRTSTLEILESIPPLQFLHEKLEKSLTPASMKALHLPKLFIDTQHSSETFLFEYCLSVLANTVQPSHKDISLCDTSSIESDILWQQLIPLCQS